MLLSLLVTAALALTPEDASKILSIEAQRRPVAELAPFWMADDPATRARAARALGRLREADAAPPLRQLADDADADVRFEVAFALGQTPGTAGALAARLARETDPHVCATLIDAMGKQSEESAIPILVESLRTTPAFLHEPEEARAAARAIGRLSMREVPGIERREVAEAVLEQMHRFDRDTRRAAAYALYRLKPAGSEGDLNLRLLTITAREPDPVAKSFLLRATASLKGVDDARDALYAVTVRDTDRGVRIATARAAAITGWEGVQVLLADPLPSVRRVAIVSVGAISSLDRPALLEPIIARGATQEAAEGHVATGDARVVEAADALRALGDAGLVANPRDWLGIDKPVEVRSAAAELLRDSEALVRLALEDDEAAVRTAAASALAEHNVPPMLLRPLLDATDPMVAAIAAEALAEHPTTTAGEPLVHLLRTSEQSDVLRATALALVALYTGDHPLVRRPADGLAEVVPRLLDHPDGAVRAAAARLATALGVPVPARTEPAALRADDPRSVNLAELSRVRSARILTSRGEVIIDLLPEDAPVTVWNFVRLADSGYFDGVRFHRVVPDFVVQGGDPRGDGTGGPGWTIPDEINPIPYDEGTVGMALSGPDTGGSQWFVTLAPHPHLDGSYTVFGRLSRGYNVVQRLQPGDRIDRIVIERAPASP